VFCGKRKESCETQACPTALPRNNAPIQWLSNDRSDVDWGDREIASEAECRPVIESQQWPETSAKHKKQLLRSSWKDQSPPASIPPDM